MTLLAGKNAIIYGAGGRIGAAVATAFAEDGAKVFLAGRTRARLEEVAARIGAAAEVAEVDALDEAAVDAHADAVAARGGLDISFNLIAHGDVQGTPLLEMSLADYERPVRTAVRTQFLTARAAARHMVKQQSGVILLFGGAGDPVREFSVGGLQVAFHAVEAMRRQLAAELGRHGVRAVTLRTGGIPETIPKDFPGRAELEDNIAAKTMLGRAATLADVGAVAAFVASDRARTMTASTVNISCGALVD
ncbi:SDR family NAD(P)-dependent oxidoreductase [Amycolatopsis australiensis]|uniref:NADP-dependent 3-hydroxy acid dehydrogenase YdfG n=1 Tax=Amycolatopsis australiensis TaxID=546364 RepID=A0A1K1T6L6_9PSEU|nr:SDR family oxidoreductase [Amycolatopsis australiensis]SFW92235.1 NADP-dependent 3-hydroxy acid dehydrogenase YdfG [Amycolatopsis australiensis]